MNNDNRIEVQAIISEDDRNSLMQGMGRHLIQSAIIGKYDTSPINKREDTDLMIKSWNRWQNELKREDRKKNPRNLKEVAKDLKKVAGRIRELDKEMLNKDNEKFASDTAWQDIATEYLMLVEELDRIHDYEPSEKEYNIREYGDLKPDDRGDEDLDRIAGETELLSDQLQIDLDDPDEIEGAKEMYYEIHNEMIDRLVTAHTQVKDYVEGKGYKHNPRYHKNESGNGTHPGCNQYEHKPGCPRDKD